MTYLFAVAALVLRLVLVAVLGLILALILGLVLDDMVFIVLIAHFINLLKGRAK